MNYTDELNKKKPSKASQKEKIRDDQVKNHSGGYVFQVDDRKRMERFLILGSEGGSYYVGQKELTQDNAHTVIRELQKNGPAALQLIKDVSVNNRAPRNDPAIFALALAFCSPTSVETQRAARELIPLVCRTGTHFFALVDAVNKMRGWGRGLKTAIGNWYQSKTPDQVAFQAVKYGQRNGWSHADVLRLTKPTPGDPVRAAVYGWITDGNWKKKSSKSRFQLPEGVQLPRVIEGYLKAQKAESPKQIVKLISEYKLHREMIPTQFLTDPDVLMALLNGMPMTAMIRNLGNMSKAGILSPLSSGEKMVTDALANREALVKARVHPMALLIALRTYKQGHGTRGGNTWTVNQNVCDALDSAFYLAFDAVPPTGKRQMLSIDISGSMSSGSVAGSSLTPREAAAAMAMVTYKAEPNTFLTTFSCARGGNNKSWMGSYHRATSADDVGGLEPATFGRKTRLDSVVDQLAALPLAGTDCSLPMRYALKNKIEVDCFTVYTDSETWAGPIHPSEALKRYRDKMGIPAKMVVVGLIANDFSIADPTDAGMLDVVGFDASAPTVMRDFIMDGASSHDEDSEAEIA